ncbi:MAG: hypothetical protein NTV52_00535 [Acidobacteria bacterium]|nr:hypothetical protein [Acidobacteriota bacterium]
MSTDLRLVKQLPSSFRLEEAKAGGRTIASFDGVAAKLPGGVTGGQPDEELGEALGLDTPETFLYSLADGLPYRFLGGRFRTDDGSTPDYKGPWVDIYAMSLSSVLRSDKQIKYKMFMFDSADFLLRRVVYDTPSTTSKGQRRVEILLDNWRVINGLKVATEIVRREDNLEAWSFRVTEAVAGPKIANETF